jgi:guanylate kinase
MPKKTCLFIVSGPAASGKTTLAENVLRLRTLNIHKVLTTTTRPPRANEVPGLDYHFISQEAFRDNIQKGLFYEYAKVHGEHFYGTLQSDIEPHLQKDIDLLLLIDVQGAKQIFEAASRLPSLSKSLVSIFLMPPSLDTIRDRLQRRASDHNIQKRLESAQIELAERSFFKHCIISTSPEADLEAFIDIYKQEKGIDQL